MHSSRVDFLMVHCASTVIHVGTTLLLCKSVVFEADLLRQPSQIKWISSEVCLFVLFFLLKILSFFFIDTDYWI